MTSRQVTAHGARPAASSGMSAAARSSGMSAVSEALR